MKNYEKKRIRTRDVLLHPLMVFHYISSFFVKIDPLQPFQASRD